jgi:hypothetical protein
VKKLSAIAAVYPVDKPSDLFREAHVDAVQVVEVRRRPTVTRS